MAVTLTSPSETLRLLRFDGVQRAAHWANAVLFGILMTTAIPLYFGNFFGIYLPRHVVNLTHLWTGLMLPIPIIISLLGPWGNAMRRDFQRFSYWTRDEIRWLRTFGRSPLRADKFNPGQKLNALLIGAAIVVMLATGAMLQWFRFFPVSWRQGATFVHDLGTIGVFLLVAGHIIMAVTHRDSLRSIFRGWVSARWASVHAPGWWNERPPVIDSSPPRD